MDMSNTDIDLFFVIFTYNLLCDCHKNMFIDPKY